MGELSPENRLLVERVATEIAAEYWLAGYTFEIGPLQLNRLLNAARSEGPSPGYGKSLGERLTEMVASDHLRGCAGRNYECTCGHLDRQDALMREAALAFTASLSGGVDLTGLRDVFEQPFDGDEDPRIRVAKVITRAEADAILEFRGDLKSLSNTPAQKIGEG